MEKTPKAFDTRTPLARALAAAEQALADEPDHPDAAALRADLARWAAALRGRAPGRRE